MTSVAFPAGGGLPGADPRAVGMSAERLTSIDRIVQRGVDAGGYPGAAVVIGRKGFSVVSHSYGSLDWTGKAPVSTDESLYDLASLTKVAATTTAIMVLYDKQQISLDAPVSRYLPDFSGGLRDKVTVRHLLTHTSGLPAGRELWRIAKTPAEARAAVLATPVRNTPGAVYEYSDLGADLLGFIVEAVSGERMNSFLLRNVYGPLAMENTFFQVSSNDIARTAPTEIAPPRGYPLRGEVHDENAYALGGIAGHAGLFSTAADLSIFAQMLLNGGVYKGRRIVSDSTIALFTKRTAGHRALGWDTCDGGAGCGQYMSERAYGHTGFTGTSLWIDPDRQMFVILLTNRVHAARAARPSKIIADIRNDLADAAVLAVTDGPEGERPMPVSFRADVARDWNRPVARTTTAAARRRAAAAKRAAVSKKAVAKKPAAKTVAKPVAKPTSKPAAKAATKPAKKTAEKSTPISK